MGDYNAFKGFDWTPQEEFLYQHHARNLMSGGKVLNPNSISTIKQLTAEFDGMHYNLPTVWDGKVLGDDESIKRAKGVGLQNFPSYKTPEEAQRKYDEMHSFMEGDVQQYLKNTGVPDAPSQ